MNTERHAETIRRWLSGVKPALARLADQTFPGLVVASIEIEAARLAFQNIPRLFSSNLRPIDPALNHDLLDLFGASDQVLSNQFSFFGRSHDLGDEIDWEVKESRGWVTELHAFDYALKLGLTFRISGEIRYARHLRRLIAHWIAENPPLQGTGWLRGPLARRMRNWILAADLARSEFEKQPDFLGVVAHSLALQAIHLTRDAGAASYLSAIDEARALLLAGKFFGGSAGAELQGRADEILARLVEPWLSAEDSAQTTPAHQLHLAAAILERLVVEGNSDSPDHFLKHALRQILQTLEAILLPGGSLPLFGPGAREDLADVGALAAVLLREDTWKSLAGQFGVLPYMLLGEEGKACFDSLPGKSWKAENRLLPRWGFYRLSGLDSSSLVVNAPRRPSPETHVDCLSYELSLQGHRVIVDSGGYAEGEQEARYFSGAEAHNLFLIDGQKPCGDGSSHRAPRHWEVGQGFTGLVWEQQLAPDLHYRRAWYCLEHRSWAILEALDGRAASAATSLLHFYPPFEMELFAARIVARSRALVVTIIPLGSPQAQPSVSSGWYAPGFGVKYPINVLGLRWSGLHLPWVGGVVIIPGVDASTHMKPIEIAAGSACLEIRGKRYFLPLHLRHTARVLAT